MNAWVEALARLAREDTPCVLVTLLDTRGSSPRESGTKMVVAAEQAFGTLGGGTIELKAQEHARALLAAAAATPEMTDFVLGPAQDQACGGTVKLLFEPVLPAAFHISLFGAGHVGRALVQVLNGVDCRVRWVDSRAHEFPTPMPVHASAHVVAEPADEVASLPAGSHVLAMTHSHEADLRIVEAALRRRDFALIGTIGSKSKRAHFLSHLRKVGLGDEAQARMICPIGLPGVGGKHPAEIAIAVAAQLLQLRDAAPAGSGTRDDRRRHTSSRSLEGEG